MNNQISVENGRKIAKEYENPLDNIIIDIASYLSPIHKELGFTPNMLTTVSLILGMGSAYYMYNNSYKIGAILLGLSYLYDCIDGYFARKYNMVTEFGDLYDHFADIFKIALVFYVLFDKFGYEYIKWYIIFIVLIILFGVHLGCQEVLYDTEESDSLAIFKGWCVGNPENTIQYTRLFGVGTFYAVLIGFIYTL